MAQVNSRYPAKVIYIKNAEGVLGVEIWFHNCISFGHLKMLVKRNLLIEHP